MSSPVVASRQLKEMAVSGGFVVEPDAGDSMIRALEAAIDSLESRWAELRKLQENPPMSDSPTARWVADHMVRTAADEDGLLTQLQATREAFPAYVEAINLAKSTYREVDQNARQRLVGIENEGE